MLCLFHNRPLLVGDMRRPPDNVPKRQPHVGASDIIGDSLTISRLATRGDLPDETAETPGEQGTNNPYLMQWMLTQSEEEMAAKNGFGKIVSLIYSAPQMPKMSSLIL